MLGRRLRQRYVQVLEVLGRNGFADLAERIGIDRLIDRGREILGAARNGEREHLPVPQRVRRMFEELGPTYVKFGQMLSTRPDLIPPEWADDFKKLQNDVPGVSFDLVEKTLEAQFPGKVQVLFRSIQNVPLAAASMAQVHRARLHDGARVVLNGHSDPEALTARAAVLRCNSSRRAISALNTMSDSSTSFAMSCRRRSGDTR